MIDQITQTEISRLVGVTQSMISQILSEHRTPSAFTAEALEEATGICREAWIWPERHFNPYFKKKYKAQRCCFCDNFPKVLLNRTKLFLRFMKKINKSSQYDLLEMFLQWFNGFYKDPESQTCIIYKIDNNKIWTFLQKGKFINPDRYCLSDFNWLFKKLKENDEIYLHNITKDSLIQDNLLCGIVENYKTTMFLYVWTDSFLFVFIFYDSFFYLNKSIKKELRDNLLKFYHILTELPA